ncbi:hypothetical protein ACE6H2_017739 [Prunus campanulata]
MQILFVHVCKRFSIDLNTELHPHAEPNFIFCLTKQLLSLIHCKQLEIQFSTLLVPSVSGTHSCSGFQFPNL